MKDLIDFSWEHKIGPIGSSLYHLLFNIYHLSVSAMLIFSPPWTVILFFLENFFQTWFWFSYREYDDLFLSWEKIMKEFFF